MGKMFSANGQRQTATLNYVSNEAKNNSSKDFANLNGTGTGHEA